MKDEKEKVMIIKNKIKPLTSLNNKPQNDTISK